MAFRPELLVDRSVSGVAVFELLGDHDMATATELRAALDEALEDDHGIVVDLSETQFIDSSVVHALYHAEEQLVRRGRRLALQIKTASIVVRALEVSNLSEAVTIAHERQEAIGIASEQRGVA